MCQRLRAHLRPVHGHHAGVLSAGQAAASAAASGARAVARRIELAAGAWAPVSYPGVWHAHVGRGAWQQLQAARPQHLNRAPCGRPHREVAGIDQGKNTAAAGRRRRLGRASRTCLQRAYAWPRARQSHPSGLQERYALESSTRSTLHQAATAARRLPRSGGCSAASAAQPVKESRAPCCHCGKKFGMPVIVQSHYKLIAGEDKNNAEQSRFTRRGRHWKTP